MTRNDLIIFLALFGFGFGIYFLAKGLGFRPGFLGNPNLQKQYRRDKDDEVISDFDLAISKNRKVSVLTIVSLVVSLTVFASTRLPVVAAAIGLTLWASPRILKLSGSESEVGRAEAIASWTESLRDTMAASSGLVQAILSTAPMASELIKEQVEGLATRLKNGVPMEVALRQFSNEVNDQSAEIVVCALLLASTSRAPRLVELLGSLSDSIRDEVSMRLRVQCSRSSARSSVRTIIVFSATFACALAVLAHTYLAPFSTMLGQVVLTVICCLYASGCFLMMRMVRLPDPVRIIGGDAR